VITCWNAQVLKEKLGSAEFRDIKKDTDKIGVVETWIGEKDKIEVNGIGCVVRLRNKKENKERHSGEVAILFRKSL
jgi:hypothetical protein